MADPGSRHVAPATPAALWVENLTVAAGGRCLVRNLSFQARCGALLWITGDNGSGKSSLLSVLAQRQSAHGALRGMPALTFDNITFYSPIMGVPPYTTVRAWLRLNQTWSVPGRVVLPTDDPLVPAIRPNARLSTLSTGEAKRLVLWSLLRVMRPFTFLDEPYEHLSPMARTRLTELLVERARAAVVVVATNQAVPEIPHSEVLVIEAAP